MHDHREAIAGVMAAHRYDREGCICACGVECGVVCDNLTHPQHLADALLGSDVLAQIRAEARAEALREAAEFIEVTAGIGANDSTYANGWYAALGYALDELRDRAKGSA